MRTPLCLCFVLVLLGIGVPEAFAQVAPVETREKVLAKAERLQVLPLDTATEARFGAAADPFNPPAPVMDETVAAAEAEAASVVTVSDAVILQEIGKLVQPTGVMEFGSNTLLLFGERRVKVGSVLSVPYQGKDYAVQIVKADARGFMLRLNNEFISKRIQ